MNCRLSIVVATLVIGTVVSAVPGQAQVRAIAPRGPAVRVTPTLRGRIGFGRGFRQVSPRPVLLPPFFYPYYDYDGIESIQEEAQPPSVVVVQPQAVAPAPPATPNPVESLVLENRAGQWVRISNFAQSPANAASTATPASPNKPSRAVLVFRDGRTEEVERYMIKGDAIFADANYWSTGSWTRRIPIAELDVAATQKMNEERGGKFNLPSGPNEVILR